MEYILSIVLWKWNAKGKISNFDIKNINDKIRIEEL